MKSNYSKMKVENERKNQVWPEGRIKIGEGISKLV